MSRLNDAVAIVTGGVQGMGASHVRGLVAEGAKVVIGDVNDEQGRALAEELGANALFSHLDVTSETSWRETIQLAETIFGPLSVLVNNAGIVQFKPWTSTSVEE